MNLFPYGMAAGPRGVNSGPCRPTVWRQAGRRGQQSQRGGLRTATCAYRPTVGRQAPPFNPRAAACPDGRGREKGGGEERRKRAPLPARTGEGEKREGERRGGRREREKRREGGRGRRRERREEEEEEEGGEGGGGGGGGGGRGRRRRKKGKSARKVTFLIFT